jgi:hypothetical protein
MIIVDLPWTYCIGAMLAAAASSQIKHEKNPFDNKYFTTTLGFLFLVFIPPALYILWRFPQWQTMQLVSNQASISPWLSFFIIVSYGLIGILGFWITYKLIQKDQLFYAHLQWILGYTLLFFIFIYGWDGTSWQRFLYDPTEHGGVLWEPGLHDGLGFFNGELGITLGIIGVTTLPLILYISAKWMVGNNLKEIIVMIFSILLIVIVISLSFGIISVLLVMFCTFILVIDWLSLIFGGLLSGLLIYLILIRKENKLRLFLKKLLLID